MAAFLMEPPVMLILIKDKTLALPGTLYFLEELLLQNAHNRAITGL